MGCEGASTSGNWMIETLRGSSRRRRVSVGGLLLLLWLACISPAPAVGAEPAHVVSPLPASDYSVRRVCPPAARGDAICLALQLVPETPAAALLRPPVGRRAHRRTGRMNFVARLRRKAALACVRRDLRQRL